MTQSILDKFVQCTYITDVNCSRGRSEVWLSRWPVKPETAGSNPVAPVLFYSLLIIEDKILRAVAQLASALGSGPRGRESESPQPDFLESP